VEHGGELVELSACRDRLRTRVRLWRDGRPAGEATGLARILLPLEPDNDSAGSADTASGDGGAELRGPTVLVLSVLPGVVNRAILLVPRTAASSDSGDGGPGTPPAAEEVLAALPKNLAKFATARRRAFAPPPGSFAARLAAFANRHPRLWAARHVALAIAKVGFGLLGLAVFVQVLLRQVLAWLSGLLPEWDLRIPWPDIDLPDIPWPQIPWPDIDLPDLVAPGWLLVLIGTAKFWGPVLVAVGIAVVEVRRRRRRSDGDTGPDDHEGAEPDRAGRPGP
jgi:hypothetical protein